jgi:hypothetical protein
MGGGVCGGKDAAAGEDARAQVKRVGEPVELADEVRFGGTSHAFVVCYITSCMLR